MNGLQSELLKYKRTFMRKLIVLFPLFFVLYALVIKLLMPANTFRDWQLLTALVFNWWPVLFLPLGMGLFATLVAGQEKRAGNYRALRAHDTPPALLWINKIAGMAFHTLLTTLVLVVAVVVAGMLTSRGAIPWAEILAASFTCWAVSLVLIPIQLWAATWKGMFLSMGIGFVGMLAGVLGAPKPAWIAVPWSWTTRLMCPIVGVHPNGVLLNAGDPLLNASVVPLGIAVSVAAFLALTALTAIWFSRREVK